MGVPIPLPVRKKMGMLFTISFCHSAVPKFMQFKSARAELKCAAPKAKMILNVVFSIFHNKT